jgi:hypothetical protein
MLHPRPPAMLFGGRRTMLGGFFCLFPSEVGTGNARSSRTATFTLRFAIALACLWFLAAFPAMAQSVQFVPPVIPTVPVGPSPMGVAVNPAGIYACVPN